MQPFARSQRERNIREQAAFATGTGKMGSGKHAAILPLPYAARFADGRI
jgi:hypothetical protein